MTHSQTKILTDLQGGRIRTFLDELKLLAHPHLKDVDEDSTRIVMERLMSVGEDLREEGIDPFVIALGLIMRADVMMWETEPRHKCELYAEALKREGEHFEKCNELYFANRDLKPILTEDKE